MEQRVLVVEDETAIRDMIAFALKRASLVPMLAEDARAAQLLIADRLPDLVLLDWMLPKAPGVGVCAASAPRGTDPGHSDHHADRAR